MKLPDVLEVAQSLHWACPALNTMHMCLSNTSHGALNWYVDGQFEASENQRDG
jgi:hypothetical protein